MGTTVLQDVTPGLLHIDRYTYWVMPLFLVGQAAWYLLTPETMFWTRAFCIVWGLAGLWAFHRLLMRLFPGQAVALTATALLATSFIYIDNAAFARPDVPCLALGLAALAFYMDQRETNMNRAMLLANTCLAASAFMHPNAIYHAVAFAVTVLWLDVRRLRWTNLLLGAAPYAVAAALWGLYISLDYAAFRAQMHTNAANNDRFTTTFNPLTILVNEIRGRYFYTFGLMTRGVSLLKAAALAAYLAGLAVCLGAGELRRSFPVRLLLVWTAVYFAGLCVFNQKLSYYMVHIVPMYIALLAVAVCWAWKTLPRLRVILAAGLLGLALVDVGGIAVRAYTRSYVASQQALVRYVREHTPPAGGIAGTAALLFEMDFDTRLRDDPKLGIGRGWDPDVIVIESIYRDHYAGWSTLRPADMAQIRERLEKEYRLGYREGEYEVYLRRRP